MEDPILVLDHVHGRVITMHGGDVIEPRLSKILEAQRKQAQSTGRSSHAGEATFWVDVFPAQLEVTLALRFDVASGAPGERPRLVRNTIRRDRDGELIGELGGEITSPPDSSELEPLSEHVLSALVSFEVRGPGTYTIEFFMNDASEAVPVHVFEGKMPGTPTS